MSLIDTLTQRLKRHPKRIVFPEGADPRIIQAARLFATQHLGIPILLGDRTTIKDNASQLDISLEGIRLLEPERSDEFADHVRKFQGLRRFKGLDDKEAAEYMRNNNYFATMMLATGAADALVSGATLSASSALRPLFQIIQLQEDVQTASSMTILESPDKRHGLDGALFLSDCAVLPDPTQEQLADIAFTTAALCQHLTNQTPRVAMLSFTTKAKNPKLAVPLKMQAATALAREKLRRNNLEAEIDGEVQVDAALDIYAARHKGYDSSIAGKANVLIFPDLTSANITSKLVAIIANARTYGQIITGLRKPAAEISRSASAHDIFGAAVIVAAQAVDKNYLYALEPHETLS